MDGRSRVVLEQARRAALHLQRNLSPDGHPAPHKPLLLLVALARVQRGAARLASYEEIAELLGNLLREYGAPHFKPTPQYPFVYLRSDGLWEVTDSEGRHLRISGRTPTGSELRPAYGGLPYELDLALRMNPAELIAFAGDIAAEYFPDQRAQVLSDAGISLEAVGNGNRDAAQFTSERAAFPAPVATQWLDVDADWIGAHLNHTFSDLFPRICQPGALAGIPLDQVGTRARNVLISIPARTWADLSDYTIGRFAALPNVGTLTVSRVVRAAWLAEENTALSSEDALTPAYPAEGQGSRDGPEVHIRAIAAAIERVAEWGLRSGVATTFGQILLAEPGDIPGFVRADLSVLHERHLSTLVRPDRVPDPQLVTEFLEALGPKAEILLRREIAPNGEPPTLQVLGDELGITRERVRQLEVKQAELANSLLARHPFDVLAMRGMALRHAFGSGVDPAGSIATTMLTRLESGLRDDPRCTVRRLLLWVAGPYRLVSEMWVRTDTDMRVAKAKVAEGCGEFVHRDELATLLRAEGFPELTPVVSGVVAPHLRAIGDGWFACTSGSIADNAWRVLELTARPMSPAEIAPYLPFERSVSSIYNALHTDHRFVRINSENEFALATWGYQQFDGIAREVALYLQNSGGWAGTLAAVQHVSETFGARPNSVRAYLGVPAFEVAGETVRLRSDLGTYPLPEPQNYVDLDGQRAVRVEMAVDNDLLRGSGRRVPVPAAVALGVRPGRSAAFIDEFGHDVVMRWNPLNFGPAIGSLRQTVCDGGLVTSSKVALWFLPDTGELRVTSSMEP